MTEAGRIYGEALYQLAKDEDLTGPIGHQLAVLELSLCREPDFLRLLSLPSLSKAERCQILDACFRGKLHPYLLNFLKILVRKGYVRYFRDCRQAYTACYHQDNGILPVDVVTASGLTDRQAKTLTRKLSRITGKEILLRSRIDPGVLGGIRLDYNGIRLDNTVARRLETLRDLLTRTEP